MGGWGHWLMSGLNLHYDPYVLSCHPVELNIYYQIK